MQFHAGSEDSPTGVFINGAFIGQGTSGVLFDNNRGRIIAETGIGTGSYVSGNFVKKEINLYTTNETSEEVLLREEFYLDSGESYYETTDQLAKAKYHLR